MVERTRVNEILRNRDAMSYAKIMSGRYHADSLMQIYRINSAIQETMAWGNAYFLPDDMTKCLFVSSGYDFDHAEAIEELQKISMNERDGDAMMNLIISNNHTCHDLWVMMGAVPHVR